MISKLSPETVRMMTAQFVRPKTYVGNNALRRGKRQKAIAEWLAAAKPGDTCEAACLGVTKKDAYQAARRFLESGQMLARTVVIYERAQ